MPNNPQELVRFQLIRGFDHKKGGHVFLIDGLEGMSKDMLPRAYTETEGHKMWIEPSGFRPTLRIDGKTFCQWKEYSAEVIVELINNMKLAAGNFVAQGGL